METFRNVLEIIGLVLRVIWGYITQAVAKMSWEDIFKVIIGVIIVVFIGMLIRRIGAFFMAMMTGVTLVSFPADIPVTTDRAPAVETAPADIASPMV
jgi:hypothetical protein